MNRGNLSQASYHLNLARDANVISSEDLEKVAVQIETRFTKQKASSQVVEHKPESEIVLPAQRQSATEDTDIQPPTAKSGWLELNTAPTHAKIYMDTIFLGRAPVRIETTPGQHELGIILYRMISGKLPFEASNPLEVLKLHLEAPLPRLDTEPMLWSLLERLTAKRKEDRYAKAEDLINSIDALLKDMTPQG